jgi:spermidine synthase
MAPKKRTKKKPIVESQAKSGSVLPVLVLACFFFSGAAGLIYEVLWIRMIDKVVGSAPFAVATVLAVFMGGLAVGSYLAGRTIDRITSKKNLLALYGKVEVVIGVYGLLLPFLVMAVKPLYAYAYNHLFEYFWIYQVFNFLGCTLLLIFPAVLMGITLPVLCRFYVTRMDHLGTRTGRLYGLNTIGAAVGSLLAGFLLVNAFGVWGALFVAAGINFVVGFLCIFLARQPMPLSFQGSAKQPGKRKALDDPGIEPSSSDKASDPTIMWALWIFAVSGFCAMAYEVIWTRLLGLIIGPTTYSFTLVIATFIIGLALGSLFFGWLGDRVKGTFFLLAGTQVCAACLVILVSQFLGSSQFFFAKLIYAFQGRFEAMILVQFVVVFLILLCPTILLGATFPLVNRIYARSLSGLGKSIGTAYALNTVGAILGSVVAGFVLIPFLGKENGLRLVMALQFIVPMAAAVIMTVKAQGHATRWLGIAAMAMVGVVLFWNYPSWHRGLLSSGRYRNLVDMENLLSSTSWFDALVRGSAILKRNEPKREIVFYGDGIGGFTTVEKVIGSLGTVKYTMVNSGKPDASSHGDRSNQTLLAHIPLLFHPHAGKALVIGLASGMTAGEVLHYPVEKMDVVEISEQVVKASGLFKPWNNSVLSDPRTRLIVQDGRNHLALSQEKYDVIISGPSNPWMAGLANLFTREYFQAAKDHLGAPGIFVQWMQSYEMNWPTFALAGRAFMDVFPEGVLMKTSPADYLFVGFSGQIGLSPAVAQKNIPYAQRSNIISLPNPHLLFQLVMTENLERLFGVGPLHTDNWPRLEFAAPKQLNTNDFSIEENLMAKRWLSPETKAIVRAGRDVDGLLDMADFFASVGSSFFAIPRFDDLSPSQQERYQKIVHGYCSEELVTNYEIFFERENKRECAELQAAKMSEHLAGDPDDATAQYNLGVALIQLGRLKDAVTRFSEAVRVKPDYAKAHQNLAVAFVQRGDYQRAITHCDRAVALGAKVQPRLLALLKPYR